MADTSFISGGQPTGNENSYRPIAGVTFQPGTPVTPLGGVNGVVVPAGPAGSESSPALSNPSGIAAQVGVEGQNVTIRFAGPVSLTTQQWDAVTGEVGGLVLNATYFLDTVFEGKLTRTPSISSGAVVAPVGVALSATDLLVQIRFHLVNP